MVLLLSLPVFVTITLVHRSLQLYAPTNLLVRRVRATEPRLRTVAALFAFAPTLLIAMHLVAVATVRGAPGWMNLFVLVLAWDAIKLALLAVRTTLLWLGALSRPKRRQDLGDGEFETGNRLTSCPPERVRSRSLTGG